jgi:hypothetical protein
MSASFDPSLADALEGRRGMPRTVRLTVENVPTPILRPDDIVIMDNLKPCAGSSAQPVPSSSSWRHIHPT